MTHGLDVIICQLADCTNVVVKCQVVVQHDTGTLRWSANDIVEPATSMEVRLE